MHIHLRSFPRQISVVGSGGGIAVGRRRLGGKKGAVRYTETGSHLSGILDHCFSLSFDWSGTIPSISESY